MSQDQPPPKHLTLIVALLTMIGPFTINTYLPSFPDIEADFAVSRALLTQSLAFYMVALAVSTLVFGPLSDRLGRRTVVIGTLLLYVLASLGCALSENYGSFLFFRLLQGVAAGGGLSAGRTMIRDVYTPQEAQRAMSRVMMLFGMSPAIAPVIGAWLHDLFGWQSVFYFLAVYSVLILFLILIWIPETLSQTMRQSIHPLNIARIYGHTLVHRRFQSLVFMVSCLFGGMFLYIAGAPTVVFDFLKLDTNSFGYLFIPMVGGMTLGSWLSGYLAHRWQMERTAGLALGLMTFGTILNNTQALFSEPQIVTTVLPLVFYTMGIGVIMPAMTVMSLDCFPQNRGAASAMQGFIQMMGNALVSSVAVPLLGFHPNWLALGQLSLIVIALLLWHFLPAQQTKV